MVNGDRISWMLIITSLLCNQWGEINCNTCSNSDDDTSICDTDSEYNSRFSHEDRRRMERIKQKSNKKRTTYAFSKENVQYFDSAQQGLAIHRDDLDHHEITYSTTIYQNVSKQFKEFGRTTNINKLQKKLKRQEYDTIQYMSDTVSVTDSIIHFKVRDDSEKLNDILDHTTDVSRKQNTSREEILNNGKLIIRLRKKKTHGSKHRPNRNKALSETFTEKIMKRQNTLESSYKMESKAVKYFSTTQFLIGKIIHNKSREENEIFHDKHVKKPTVIDKTNFTGNAMNWAFTTKTSNENKPNGQTRVFKKGYHATVHHFGNAQNLRSNNSLIKLIVEKITKRNDPNKTSPKIESTTILSLKDFLSKHGLRATEMTSKTYHQYDHKIYGVTQKNIVKPTFVDQKIIEKQPLRTKFRNKMNLLRSTRISIPEALGLQVKQASLEELPSSRLELSSTTLTTANINTDLIEDLSPYAIEKQMKRVALKYSQNMNVTIEILGRTVEYNDIVLLKITEAEKKDAYFRVKEIKYADEVEQKKIIFIVHGLSVMGMRYLISNEEVFHKLLSYYTDHLDKFDIFLIPMANPDGYAATCNSQAGLYWNKNMSPQSDCPGVALDRNFNVEWNNTQNISSCSAMYPGPAPFSEAETRAVQEVFHLYGHRIAAYIHVHASSFDERIFKGDAVLYPRGYTEIQTDDDKYIDLKGEIDEAMKNSSFRVLSVTTDTLYNWYGKVTGSSVDYASSVYGIPYALEFAMQVYKGIQLHAMESIWKRVIDVVFNNIWKNSQRSTEY